jgi:hypothetical protein
MRFFSKFLNQNKLTRYFKNKRNGIVNRYFLKQTSTQQYEVVEKLKNLDFIVFCIAFNKPDCIQIMIDCWKRYAINSALVVVDNSSCKNAKRKISELCHLNGIFYLSLPRNPEWHPNRLHALAMNWIFYNLVIEIKPYYFGYLDHDCFPYKKFDLSTRISGHEIYGDRRISYKYPEVWSLWAGFCFFDSKYLEGREVNFTHIIELGLDTGGNNWKVLYKFLSQQQCKFARVKSGVLFESKYKQKFHSIIDSFVHVGSSSHNFKSKNITRDEFLQLSESLKRCDTL